MAKRKGNLGRSARLILRTRPFLWARLAVYGVFFFATVGYTATFVALLRAYSTSTVAQLVILVVAAGMYLFGRRYLARNLTYAGHAPHVQAMVQILKGQKLPRGNAQIEAATRHINDNFRDTARLYHVERLLGRVLREVRDVVIQPGTLRPLPGFQKLGRVGWLIERLATNHVRDGIFGYTLWAEDQNVWRSARRGVLIYAKDGAPIMTSAVRVSAVGFLVGAIMIGIALWPGWPLVQWGLDSTIFMFLAILAGFVKAVWVLKTALFDPFGVAWMVSVFVGRAESVEGDLSEHADKLARASKRYQELSAQSREAETPAAEATATETPAAEATAGKPEAGEAPVTKKGEAPADDDGEPNIVVDLE